MYITIPASHRARQITIKDFLEGNFSFDPIPYTRDDLPYTRTFKSAENAGRQGPGRIPEKVWRRPL